MRILTCVKDCIKNPNAHIRRCLHTNYSKQEVNFPWNKTANGEKEGGGSSSIPYCLLSWNKETRQAELKVHNWPGYNHSGVKYIIWAIGNGAVKYVCPQDDVTSPHTVWPCGTMGSASQCATEKAQRWIIFRIIIYIHGAWLQYV